MSRRSLAGLALGLALCVGPAAQAAVFDVSINGTDAIFLAGRTDLAIPDANLAWGDGNAATYDGMLRHGGPTPEESKETLPPTISVLGGQVVRVVNPAVGGVNFFNGLGPPYFGPEGNGTPGVSNLSAFAGISGYIGTQGALVGVFLTDAIASGSPPPTLDFSNTGLGINFTTLSPEIGQVFFIGDGQNAAAVLQQFIAPLGATRLALGIADGFGFVGVPGAYDDNDGTYRIRVGVDEIPQVPLPAALPLFATGLGALGLAGWRRKKAKTAA